MKFDEKIVERVFENIYDEKERSSAVSRIKYALQNLEKKEERNGWEIWYVRVSNKTLSYIQYYEKRFRYILAQIFKRPFSITFYRKEIVVAVKK